MTPMGAAKLKRSLVGHEGRSNLPYTDTKNKITIGIGYNLTDRGLSDSWIDQQYAEDVHYFYSRLCDYDWYRALNEDRQIVLIDMAFMGMKKFLTFRKMIAALEKSDFIVAANEMLNSTWSQQVGKRSFTLAEAMRKGVYDV